MAIDMRSATTKNPQGRGETTRAAIVAAAEELLLERGYAGMTMREVAQRAGVSPGNAYYYFSSKEDLVHGFYERLQHDHARAAEEACLGLTTLDDRVRAVLHAWLDEAAPLHGFLGSYVSLAAAPHSPLSPFSSQSRPAREAALAMWSQVVNGAPVRTSTRLRAELPRLLWLGHLAIVMFWVGDTTPGQQRTRDLIDRSTPIIGRLVRLTALPGLARAADDLVSLIQSITP
jgi:AcrR family transcriptional regulator